MKLNTNCILILALAVLLVSFYPRKKLDVLVTDSTDAKATFRDESAEEMTIHIRPFNRLGSANHGWLNANFHFSFSEYYDPRRMNWGGLRVINDDIIQYKTGFPSHPHRSMEIITYVLKQNFHPATKRLEGGEGMKHKDSTGNEGVTQPGDVQVMSVGSEGVVHSEYHAGEKNESVNSLQIWILPDKRIQKTTWGTRHFPREDTANKFIYFASGLPEDKDTNALPINSYSRIVGVTLTEGGSATYDLGQNRLAYAVVTRGEVEVNGVKAESHDGIAIEKERELVFTSKDGGEILLTDTHPV